MATIPRARDKEAQRIRQANRAAAVGRLFLCQCDTWHEFLTADILDLKSLPRRKLRSGIVDIKARLDAEIRKFCTKNFLGMDERKLSLLYERIKAFRGLEIPLSEFEKEFAPINPSVLKGRPRHLTICISLWGFQFKFPEELLSKDLLRCLSMAQQCRATLQEYELKPHSQLLKLRAQIAESIGQREFAVRAAISNCFNLIEAYLNGISWDYVQQCNDELSNRTRKLLEDNPSATIRDKLIKYPEKITGKPLWSDEDPDIKKFLETVKPFRDSIMHPSPFLAPQQFGGYDKLRHFYGADYDTAITSAILLVSLIKRIHAHIADNNQMFPTWLSDLDTHLQKMTQSPEGTQNADHP